MYVLPLAIASGKNIGFNKKRDFNLKFLLFAKISVTTFSLTGIFRCYINPVCDVILCECVCADVLKYCTSQMDACIGLMYYIHHCMP